MSDRPRPPRSSPLVPTGSRAGAADRAGVVGAPAPDAAFTGLPPADLPVAWSDPGADRDADEPPAGAWRRSVRLAVLDPAYRLLLVRACDPAEPERPPWWELPGGGVEPGEEPLAAAIREVEEETGVVVPWRSVESAAWHRRATFTWYGVRFWQDEVVRAARLAAPPDLVPVHRTAAERPAFLGQAWLGWDDVRAQLAAGVRTYPGTLLAHLPRLLHGEPVEEPFERWS